MEFIKVIRQRRSSRKFKKQAIPDNILMEMLEAARLAPTSGNSQSHYFGVIKNEKVKTALAEAAGRQMWIAEAPVVTACCADISWDIAEQPDDDFGVIVNKARFGSDFIKYLNDYPNRKACVTLFKNASPLIPTEHIFLTAVSHGLSACIIGYLDKNVKDINDIVFYDKW